MSFLDRDAAAQRDYAEKAGGGVPIPSARMVVLVVRHRVPLPACATATSAARSRSKSVGRRLAKRGGEG
eukprot:COSAG02_NODE_1348_length_13137_cov_10.847293_4_plen_69_part_00